MESNLFFISLLFVTIVVYVPCASAREVPGETLVAVLKEETLNEAIKDLVGHDDIASKVKTACNDHPVSGKGGEKRFADDIEPRPNFPFYGDDDFGPKGKKGHRFSDNIEPRPNFPLYGDDDFGLKGKKDHRFTDNIEPRPNFPLYGDDDFGLKGKKDHRFTDNIEPRPNFPLYGDDDIGQKGNRFTDDFEPRPDATKSEE